MMGTFDAMVIVVLAFSREAFGMSDEVFNHSLECSDLPDDNSTLRDLRPCVQVPIKPILVDGRCDYREIDEGRNYLCAVEGGKAKGSSAFSGNNKPKKIFRGNSMEQSKEVTNRDMETGKIWIQYNFSPRAVMVHKFHFSRPILNVTSTPSSYQLLGFGRDGNVSNGWNFIHRFQDISIFPGQRTVHGIPYRRLGRFLKYRLVITGTLWKQNGPRESGNVVIGDLQFCYQKLTTHCLYHIRDSHVEESSKWSDSWSGAKAFNGTTTMWASALQYHDSFTPQWITFEYPQPKTIKKFSFMGPSEKRWFADGPISYRLEATNDYVKWETLYNHDNGDVFDTDITRREHEITREPKPYKKYKFVVFKTGWMQKSISKGYVVVRDFLLC